MTSIRACVPAGLSTRYVSSAIGELSTVSWAYPVQLNSARLKVPVTSPASTVITRGP